VELAQAGREIQPVRPDGLGGDRHALDAPAAIEHGKPGGERLAHLALGVVERATDGAGRARHRDGVQ